MSTPRPAVCHRDGSVTYWSVTRQQYVRHPASRPLPPDDAVALPDSERRRVRRHLPVDCDCGRITDASCPWRGPWRDTVAVEYVPEWVRDSHKAAGNPGVYPHNGAIRARVQRQCAEELRAWAGEWARVLP